MLLPSLHSMDMEYDDVNEHCVQDLDVLMLYDMRGVAFLPDANYLDPAEWFFAFLPDRAQVSQHLLGKQMVLAPESCDCDCWHL